MTERELNQAVARRTGDDLATIRGLGFSLVTEEETGADDAGWESRVEDWEEPEPRDTEWFRHRRLSRPAA